MKADQVLALIQAYVDRDGDRFRKTALQIAAHETEGAPKVAQRIHAILHSQKGLERMGDRAIPLAFPRDMSDVLVQKIGVPLEDVVLTAGQAAEIARMLAEQGVAERLLAHGVRPRRRLLFSGPSGTGKSLLAGALGHELGLPCIVVQLHALIGQYMGTTGAKLAKVFEAMAMQPGVYVLDELDAVGEARGRSDDVGESRRIVSGLLQLLDNEETQSLLVGTTNRLLALDPAIVRRFQLVLPFERPGYREVEALVGKRFGRGDLARLALAPDFAKEVASAWMKLEGASELSLAAVAEACDSAVRLMVLADKDELAPRHVTAELALAASAASSRVALSFSNGAPRQGADA